MARTEGGSRAASWLVQNQQGRVRLEGLDDPQFAFHAGAVLTQPPPQVAPRQFQPVTESLPVLFVHRLAVEAGEEIERFKPRQVDRKSTRLNSSHLGISY